MFGARFVLSSLRTPTHRIVLIRKERFFRWRKFNRNTGYKSTHCFSFAESIVLPVILKRYYNVTITIEIAVRLNGKTCDTRTCQVSSCDALSNPKTSHMPFVRGASSPRPCGHRVTDGGTRSVSKLLRGQVLRWAGNIGQTQRHGLPFITGNPSPPSLSRHSPRQYFALEFRHSWVLRSCINTERMKTYLKTLEIF